MKTNGSVTTVFFDLGGTLVEPQFDAAGDFTGFTLLPNAAEGLQKLAAAKVRLGVISNTGKIKTSAVRDALAQVKLLPVFEEDLIILSGEVNLNKSGSKIFRLSVARAGIPAASCAFVGDEPSERRNSQTAGMHSSKSLESFLKTFSFKNPGPTIDFSAISSCIKDARDGGLDASTGPGDPTDFHSLLGRLQAAKSKLPPTYREHFAEPFIAELNRLGPADFNRTLANDPRREQTGGLMMDIAHSILQNAEGFESLPTDAFEEVVTDLYDGFLSAEDRSGIKLPDNTVLPPLVKWGNPDFGPYTWPIDATSTFNAEAGVVNLPPANARKGLFAWTALPHETAGHDILHADDGLEAEFSTMVFAQIRDAGLGAGLAEYWSDRIDETASDVMGILNMGPAAAIGLIVYFRGLNAAFGGDSRLRNDGPASDPHPADILRGFLAAATVRLLSFDGATAWGDAIENETMKDVSQIRVAGVPITVARAKRSCEIVAHALAATRAEGLNNHSVLEIQDWRNRDEEIVNELKQALITNSPISAERANGVYAAHVVAAAAMVALSGTASVSNVFQRMLAVLKKMHDSNPAWGPLFVFHPGAISRDCFYVRHETAAPVITRPATTRRSRAVTPAEVPTSEVGI